MSLSGVSSDNSSTSEVESRESPSHNSSGDSSSSQSASNPLSVASSGNSAVGTSLVLESSDDSVLDGPADVSLVLTLSPGGTFLSLSSVESSDDSSTSPGTGP